MSRHEWCQDVPRDEAVRAAEDAAAVPAIQHRDLPDAVAELRERVARLEAGRATIGSGDVFADVVCGSTDDEVVRLTAERDAARAEAERLKAKIVVLEGHSRMDIEREIAVEEAWERCGIEPHWPDDEPGCSQRYAASMEAEIGRLRARAAELEAAPAASGTEPLECEVVRHSAASINLDDHAEAFAELERERPEMDDDGRQWANAALEAGRYAITRLTAERDAARAEAERLRTRVAELEQQIKLDDRWSAAAPAANAGGGAKQEPEPRGWLTAEEADAVDHAADIIEDMEDDDGSSLKPKADALRSLLARSSPPRVKRPPLPDHLTVVCVGHDAEWIAAIRAAGGEVDG